MLTDILGKGMNPAYFIQCSVVRYLDENLIADMWIDKNTCENFYGFPI